MIKLKVSKPAASAAPAEVLWREFSHPLRRFLRTRTRTEADADDLLQEVFVRIHKALPVLREPAKLQGWVYPIIRPGRVLLPLLTTRQSKRLECPSH